MGGERGVEGGSGHKAEGPKVKGEVTKVGPVTVHGGRLCLGPSPTLGLPLLLSLLSSPAQNLGWSAPLGGGGVCSFHCFPFLGPVAFLGLGAVAPHGVGRFPKPCLGGSRGVLEAGG